MLPRSGLGAPLLIAASCLLQPAAQAEEVERPQSDETTANNPLSIVPAIQVQNYVQPLLKGAAGSGINQPLFRAIMPFDAFSGKNLLRFSAPMGTSAWDPGGKVVGLGDLTLFSVRVFKISHNAGVGFGPLLVAPTATNDALGSKQWQLGAQGTFSAHYRWGLLAALLSYQQPWDGQSKTLTFQPFVFRNIGKGFYLRSSGISNLDTRSGSAVIPIGLGLGKVTRLPSGNLLNLYLEPQYSIIARGDGQPEFQVFSGFNLQFPHKR